MNKISNKLSVFEKKRLLCLFFVGLFFYPNLMFSQERLSVNLGEGNWFEFQNLLIDTVVYDVGFSTVFCQKNVGVLNRKKHFPPAYDVFDTCSVKITIRELKSIPDYFDELSTDTTYSLNKVDSFGFGQIDDVLSFKFEHDFESFMNSTVFTFYFEDILVTIETYNTKARFKDYMYSVLCDCVFRVKGSTYYLENKYNSLKGVDEWGLRERDV